VSGTKIYEVKRSGQMSYEKWIAGKCVQDGRKIEDLHPW
jgi:hypothetical protein